MQINGEHIVEKLVVEVTTTSSREGYAIKNNARSFIDRCIVPAIEQYISNLEQHMDPDQIIQIDRLSIDIDSGTSDLESSELEFAVREEFDKVIRHTLEELDTARQAAERKTRALETVQTAAATPESVEAAERLKIRMPSQKFRQINGLFYFLEYGTRPWWSKDAGQFNTLLEERSLLKAISAEKALFIRNLVTKGNNRTVRGRLIRQFSDDFLAKALVAENTMVSSAQLEQIVHRLFDRQQTVLTREETWHAIVRHLLREWSGQPRTDRSLVQELLRQLQPGTFSEAEQAIETIRQPLQAALQLMHAITGQTVSETHYETILRSVRRTEQGALVITEAKAPLTGNMHKAETGSTGGTTRKEPETDIEPSETKPDVSNNVSQDDLKPETEPSSDREAQTLLKKQELPGKKDAVKEDEELPEAFDREDEPLQQPDLDQLLVDNAGLILLHPFLKYFFISVGLLDEENRITDQPLAAHVLHYIATGQECDFEHGMLLEKYLVGIPLEESIARDVPIPDSMKEEVEELLNAFKQNWKSMSGSSSEAIRETFIRRSGKLIVESPQSRLVIERKTVDILLDQLTWTISMIRFPWMKDMLYVEW